MPGHVTAWRFASPPPTSLPPAGECHLWPLPIGLHEIADQLSDPGERAQAERFRDARARSTFIVSRLGQRAVLARYLGIDPAQVAIDRTCARCGDPFHGRPDAHVDGLDYSVSHSGPWCLIAVAGAAVGVDIERTDAIADVAGLARHTLNGLERAEFAALAPAAQAKWFYRAWARKEAATKAVGQGLGIDVSTVDVRGNRTSADGVALWLRDVDGPEGYVVALASATRVDRLTVFDLAANLDRCE